MVENGMMAFALLGAGWVLWLLVGLSVLCVAVSIERAWFLRSDATPAESLRAPFQAFLEAGDVDTLAKELRSLKGFEARVLSSGLGLEHVDGAERAIAGTLAAERLQMERGLAILATTGANAPFIGLFGTVLGIIAAFRDLARDPTGASDAVMAGISEALVATAVGLLVAIPAVVLYNAFQRWVKTRLGKAESLAQLMLARYGG